jgi:hypothetical protein
MRFLWTLLKVIIGLAIAIPVILIALTTALGLFGALAALAVLVLRVAIVCLVVYGAVRLAINLFGGGFSKPKVREVKMMSPPPPADPYYEAAMRELDRDVGR